MFIRKHLGIAAVVAGSALVVGSGPAQAAPGDDLTPGQRDALSAGIQITPKGSASAAKSAVAQANPYLGLLPTSKVDYSTWRDRMSTQAKERAKRSSLTTAKRQAAGAKALTTLVHDEQEPAGTSGSNDSRENAEPISGFGTGRRQSNVLRILGGMPDLSPAPRTLAPVAEDNGAIPLAGSTGIDGTGARTTTGVLGDGPHGTDGDATNDFDFYSLKTTAGRTITVDTNGSAPVDTVVAVYNAAGERLAADDDGGEGTASLLSFVAPADGTYYVLVAGYARNGPFPRDPMDSGSGTGGAAVGSYRALIQAADVDRDFYSFSLQPGDVIGGTVTGSSKALTIYRPDGRQMVGAEQTDASAYYPPESPLPGGGNTTMAYVAETAGSYVLELGTGVGNYDVRMEAYRPGAETDPEKRVQTVFLDFDGARVNTGIWGGPGVRTLSPFSSFIAKWGLTRSQEATLIDQITAEVTENIKRDTRRLNPNVEVRVVNSKDNRDIFGQENVTRVIVGGTIAESGISTIGIAQYIDPGNFNQEDSAVVLLDVLSAPSGPASSLNTYLNASSDRVAFVSQAVGNVTAHEIGHLIGNYHTDNANEQHSLMDAGGTGFGNLFGVGPDNVGGTADDEDVDFALDEYIPAEGFTGHENTLNVAAWAHTGRK
jgi:hypothetical protein